MATISISITEPEIELILKCPDGEIIGNIITGEVITLIVPDEGVKFFDTYDEAVEFFHNQVKCKNYEYITVEIKHDEDK